MKIFKFIWNLFFGSQSKDKFAQGGIIENFEDQEKENCPIPKGDDFFNPIKIDSSMPSGDDFFVSNEIIQKEINTDKDFLSSENKPKKKRKKNIVGQKTLNEIKEYLIAYGSLDVLTCEQKFKVKSLHNFIWFLRKDGFVFKTEKIFLHNELGKKVEVVNYKLITKK
jgi:hypothetical protein